MAKIVNIGLKNTTLWLFFEGLVQCTFAVSTVKTNSFPKTHLC